MTTTQTELAALIDEYLQLVFAADPIQASQLGLRDYDSTLGDHSAEAYTEEIAKRQLFLSRFHAIDPTILDTDARLDHQLAQMDVRTSLRRLQERAIWMCAPYWYVEQLGSAFSLLMRDDGQSAAAQAERLWARLRLAPRYLATVQSNLTAITAPLHVEMALAAVKGLRHFLATAIPLFARQLEETLQQDLERATATVQRALDGFEQFLHTFHAHATGSFACGPDHFDYLLKHFHLLDLDHRQLHDLGLAQMAADKAALESYARELDSSRSWMEQIEQLKDGHPQGSDFLTTYQAEIVRARGHCVRADLLTLPAGEQARVKWLPEYLRSVTPLETIFATPPFAQGMYSDLAITPLDMDATAACQQQHIRDNCTAFARSITLHETYPGHHTQTVHHKLATTESRIRRYFSSPLLVKGWQLYSEDLMEESGFMAEPSVRLFKLRNALWRAVSMVIDSGLHTRTMQLPEAVDLLVNEVNLDRRVAEGEVRRYTTHNHPTIPSAYLLGKAAIHDLRRRWQTEQGDEYSLKGFHDTLLSHGSLPIKLIAARMVG